ncbi:MAG: hypothetical protein A2Y21_08200 [Clostridiales bacterium GWC2_40_7]|nr:MAG: hypothetical protein A2Y21_08200 [Clostridiales bacterium GWC2_40_7]
MYLRKSISDEETERQLTMGDGETLTRRRKALLKNLNLSITCCSCEIVICERDMKFLSQPGSYLFKIVEREKS